MLDERGESVTPARLPALALLERMFSDGTLNQSTLFTSVGYGDYAGVPAAKKRPYANDGFRRYAVGSFNALIPATCASASTPPPATGAL